MYGLQHPDDAYISKMTYQDVEIPKSLAIDGQDLVIRQSDNGRWFTLGQAIFQTPVHTIPSSV